MSVYSHPDWVEPDSADRERREVERLEWDEQVREWEQDDRDRVEAHE